jgi:hypothetical protein
VIDSAEFTAGLEIFFGDVSDALCRVYARRSGADSQDCTLSGTLSGPMCPYAHTLPVTLAFVDRGPGEFPLAEAYVPEPCFWTPEMPHVYRAQVQLCKDGRVVATAERIVGIRTLGAIGRKLLYDSKRWVLRGVRAAAVPATDLDEWRTSGAAMIVSNPGDALCEQASRIGVLLVAELDAFENDEIRRLCRWPAVGMVTLPAQSPVELGGLRHNLLLAERFDSGRAIAPASWAQVAVCEASDPAEFAARTSSSPIAIIASRPVERLASVAEGRSRCDHLQRDLAGRGDVSGYIV